MLRNGRTGHTWHLVVDHIMLVMKMRSSSPVNRLVGLYRGFMCMYKKQKKKKKEREKKKVVLIGYFAYYIPLWDQCIK